MQTKTVIWIELTSPWDENLTKKYFEKMDKYNKLVVDLREGKHHGVNTSYAKPQAINERLDSTLSFSGSCG